eukprot:scaffold25.g5136.t1
MPSIVPHCSALLITAAPASLQPLLGPLLYLAAGLLALVSVQGLLRLPEARRAEAKRLASYTPAQRRLLGLQEPPTPARGGAATPAPRRPPKSPASLGPPLRGGRATPIAEPEESAEQRAAASPLLGAWSGGRASPYNPRQATTPDQLQRVLDSFEESMHAGAGEEQAPHVYASPLPGVGPAAAGAVLGAGAPTYRPSAVPRGAAPVATESGKVGPSSQAARAAALERLGVTEEDLEYGEERLREWMAFQVLKPLVAHIDSAAADVAAAAARLGWAGVQLAPLPDTLAGTGRSSAADDAVVVDQVRQQLLARMPAAGAAAPAEAVACLEACNAYLFLSALVKGEAPPNLLPPAPPAYIVSRIRELADGSCVGAFSWNRGGTGWSADLPQDASLAFYLLAAFLAAPQWVTGLVGMQVGGQPLFQLLAGGDALLTASGASVLFHAFFLLLKHCQQADGGVLGGRSLQFLGLGGALRKQRPWAGLFGGAARLLAHYF